MARYLTRGMVVLADDHPGTESVLRTAREYAQRTIVVAPPDRPDVADARMVHPRRGVTIDAAFRCAGDDQIPWVAIRRDFAEPRAMLGQVLEATGRRARKDLPGFAVVFVGAQPRPIRRILAIIDRADGQPSGLLILAAVAAAQATGADLDVLLMGAPGEAVGTPTRVDDAVRVTRDKDLYEQGMRRAKESGIRANWITGEDVADKRSLVLEQIAEGDYDLVIDDLGSIRLGGRIGRGGRIRSSVSADGPAQIVRAILEQTDVPLALVLDGVRLGLVPPVVVKGGAGAVLALGIIASGAPAATASPSELAAQQASVSQSAEAYSSALDQAAALAAPAEIEATLATGTSATEADGSTETGAQSDDADEVTDEATTTGASAVGDDVDSDVAAEDDAPPDVPPTDTAPTDTAPADLAPEDVVPEAAPDVDPDDVDVDSDVSADDVAAAEHAAEESADELAAAEDAFDEQQEAAVAATEEVEVAAEAAQESAADLDVAAAEYDAITTLATDVVSDATGMTGALPGGATQEDLAAAEAAQAEALADVEAAGESADEALLAYEAAAAGAAAAQAELTDAAAAVTAADAAHQEDAALADATADAYEEAVANSRVTPVPGYEITTAYGVPGPHWSTGYHTGVDYAAPEGTEVVAAASGTVVYAQNDGGSYGNRIVVEHENGYYTTYNHLSDIDVEVGQEVTAGDHIGEVGNTGNSFGAHLHFEVTQGGDGWGSGSFEDPEAWLAGDIG